MNKLSEEEKNDIVLEYGSNLEVITKIEKILSDCDLGETEYYELICEIAFEYECNETKKDFKDKNIFESLEEIIKHVVVFKYKEKAVTKNNSKELKIILKKLEN